MKRNTFKTKNLLLIRRYLVFVLIMAVLFIVFLCISNFGRVYIVKRFAETTTAEQEFERFSNLSDAQRQKECYEYLNSGIHGNRVPVIYIYDTKHDSPVWSSQLDLTKQAYVNVSSLEDVPYDTTLLIVHDDSISADELMILQKLVEKKVALMFIELPDTDSLRNYEIRDLLGIRFVGDNEDWIGMRVSSDLLTGNRVEDAKYESSGLHVTLSEDTKIYACALPENYEEIDNEDLPPIIWRHVDAESGGRVYVYNGVYSEYEMGYVIIPEALAEINGDYIYPIINAYCVSVSGYPYATNETKEAWTRLYARDKLQIQQDMFSAQLQKYVKSYNEVITCFSPEFDIMNGTEDVKLSFYTDEILSSRGLLARYENGKLKLDGNTDWIRMESMSTDFSFLDAEDVSLGLPICFNSCIDDAVCGEYKIAGWSGAMGFFLVNLDYDDVLNYEGEQDTWTVYCKDQEVMLSTQNKGYGWMEQVTVKEAFGRLLMIQQMDIGVQYEQDQIVLDIDNFTGQAWFMLRSDKDVVSMDGGNIEKIGTNCYFVSLTEDNAIIKLEEN